MTSCIIDADELATDELELASGGFFLCMPIARALGTRMETVSDDSTKDLRDLVTK
jgi:hypothetical protein